MSVPEFTSFSKIPRWSREVIVTEKIDGTNGQIVVENDGSILVGSRNRWISPSDDNFGFAKWVEANREALVSELGPGRHFGEWWGQGIQRGYGLEERRFSLFNVNRHDPSTLKVCRVVPVLWRGNMNEFNAEAMIAALRVHGSQAAPGFKHPEGIIVYHVAGGHLYKKTLERDETPKTNKVIERVHE